MIPVTSYKSFDGTLFDDAKECADYETHCRQLAKIIDKLPRFDRADIDWIDGFTYYQHDPELFMSVFTEFCEYIDSRYPNTIQKDTSVSKLIQAYYLLIWNIGDKPSVLAVVYFDSVDDQFRQYSHDFFMNHPGEMKPMNP